MSCMNVCLYEVALISLYTKGRIKDLYFSVYSFVPFFSTLIRCSINVFQSIKVQGSSFILMLRATNGMTDSLEIT